MAFGLNNSFPVRRGILIYQAVAGAIYVASNISLVPPSRLSPLAETTKLDFFPNSYVFLFNGIAMAIFLITWQVK